MDRLLPQKQIRGGKKSEAELKKKWITIKILNSVKQDIEPFIRTGKFSNVSDFVTYSIRSEIMRLTEDQA